MSLAWIGIDQAMPGSRPIDSKSTDIFYTEFCLQDERDAVDLKIACSLFACRYTFRAFGRLL